jgi:hypothetical protein
MYWLSDLIDQENALRERLAELAEHAEPREIPPATPAEFDRAVRPTVEAIQAALDDYLCGRDMEERFWMNFKVRLRLPLFCHLRSLFGLVSAAEGQPAA